MRVNVLIQL